MSEIKNDGLDQYGAGPFEQQQFGIAGVEGVKAMRVKVGFLCSIIVQCSVLRDNLLLDSDSTSQRLWTIVTQLICYY